ncbi:MULTISPECIES: MFS transporter [unclassified Roseitalea]|uniref:MFS transporter n=1 Tax=unclassified Roseitalea TaxID=2639107 RepID=UPI00273EFCAA|nr:MULTISPECIES: MFS transporter [unclassified Roseitalea]
MTEETRPLSHQRLQGLALLLAVALLVLGNGLQATIVGVRGGLEAMSQEIIGLIMSAYFVGFVLGSVYIPGLIQQVGHVRTFAALASIASAAALGFVIFVGPFPWVMLRAVTGACFAGMVIVTESWLNAGTTRDRRGRVLAVYSLVFYAAWAGGQPLLNVAPVDGFVLFALVSVLFSLALVPITLTRTGVPGVVEADRADLKRLHQISPLGLIGAFALGLSVGAFWGMAPTFGQRIGLTEAEISIFLMLPLIGALLLQWPLGWVSDLVDRRWIILGACSAAAVCASGLMLTWDVRPFPFYLLVLLLGGFAMPVYSLCVAHVNDQIDTGEVVAAASGLILVYGLGSALGPFAASVVMGQFGPAGLFAFMSAILGLFAIYGLWRIGVSAAPDKGRKESYVSVPQTSHAVLPLHKHSPQRTPGKRAPR